MARTKRLGVLVPSSNNVIEVDLLNSIPPGFSFHVARMPGDGARVEVIENMNRSIEESSRSLSEADVDLILYACTSGSFLGGKGHDEGIADRIKKASGRIPVTTSGAVLEALEHLKLRQVSVVTPYPEEINSRIRPYLEANEIGVTNLVGKGLGKKTGRETGDDPPESIQEFVMAQDHEGADGVFLSCTGWQAMAVAERLEERIGKPVVTSNQASIWSALRKLGHAASLDGYGLLMRSW